MCLRKAKEESEKQNKRSKCHWRGIRYTKRQVDINIDQTVRQKGKEIAGERERKRERERERKREVKDARRKERKRKEKKREKKRKENPGRWSIVTMAPHKAPLKYNQMISRRKRRRRRKQHAKWRARVNN